LSNDAEKTKRLPTLRFRSFGTHLFSGAMDRLHNILPRLQLFSSTKTALVKATLNFFTGPFYLPFLNPSTATPLTRKRRRRS
jgi:hypothetical protein